MTDSIISAVLNNLLGYDMIIIIFGIINIFIFAHAMKQANMLYSYFVPPAESRADKKHVSCSQHEIDEREVRRLRNKAVFFYTLFINISALFPLLGILGTVWSLLGMAGGSIDRGFYTALTSTAWGLIAAILFKMLCETPLTSMLDSAEREADHYLNMLETGERTEADETPQIHIG